MRNSTNVVRARTILMPNGIRVNWRNVPHFTLKENEDSDNKYTALVKWKFKAGLMEEAIELGGEDFRPAVYFKQYQIVPLTPTIYVNLNNIMMIEEQAIHGPQEKVMVKIVLIDGFHLAVKMDREKWIWWKQNYA
jgi:hypothetical protein